MTTTINFILRRSAERVRARRLQTRQNVPSDVDVSVAPADLPESIRAAILDYEGGHYPPTMARIRYDDGYSPNRESSYGHELFWCDADQPTAADVAKAFSATMKRIADAKAGKDRREAENAAAERATVAAWLATPLLDRVGPDGSISWPMPEMDLKRHAPADVAAVRELARLRGVEKLYEQVATDRATLADFLSHVPDDALRGVVKRLTVGSGPAAALALRKKVDDASPDVAIFGDEEDDYGDDNA